MPIPSPGSAPHPASSSPPNGARDYRTFFYSELRGRKICFSSISQRVGKISDIAFKMTEAYPDAVGIVVEHGWGKPAELIPWAKVTRIDDDFVFVSPPDQPDPATIKYGAGFPCFIDQPGWILLESHLMGKTIFDMDGRRTEVVNDVHLLVSHDRMILIHVDTSFNGFLRRWGLSRILHAREHLINWRYVQPLSLEDAVAKDAVRLSITRKQIEELPPEDLADTLEELTGKEQQALFSALEPETAAETLVEAEPRTQRQLIADLRQERATKILQEMSIPQLADLLSVLPHEDAAKMLRLLPADQAQRIGELLSQRESVAQSMLSADYLALPKEALVGAVLALIRNSSKPHDAISYIYVIEPGDKMLLGVVDLRDLVLARDQQPLSEIMVSPVVTAEADDTRDDLAELFLKYHFRMLPVVDRRDHLLGVIHFNDITKGLMSRLRV
ncbi:MAG: magnesium transporter MgtE N-terminal domain-containing protein [Phycisphaerae bacterium]